MPIFFVCVAVCYGCEQLNLLLCVGCLFYQEKDQDKVITSIKINVGELGSSKYGRDGITLLQDQIINAAYGGTSIRTIMYDITNTKFKGLEIENITSVHGPAHGVYLTNKTQIEINDATFKHLFFTFLKCVWIGFSCFFVLFFIFLVFESKYIHKFCQSVDNKMMKKYQMK